MTVQTLTPRRGPLLIIAAILVPTIAQAQSPARLYEQLGWRRNAHEIDLTETQYRQIEELKQKYRDTRSELNRAMESMLKETQTKVLRVLTRKQLTRLSELYFQGRGTRALQDAETASRLGLTDEQIKKIKAVRRELWSRAGRKLNAKQRNDKYMAVLTRAQQDRWKKMLGGEPRKVQPTLNLPSDQQSRIWELARKVSSLTNGRPRSN